MRVAGERHGAERRRVCKYGGRKSLNMVVVESQLVQCAKTAQRRRSDLTDVVMRDADELQPGRRRAISGGSRRRAEAVAAREAVIQPQNQFHNEEGSECVSETEEEHPVWHDSNAVCTPSVK